MKESLIKVTLVLNEKEYRELRHLAIDRNTSVSSLLRDLIKTYLSQIKKAKR